ncbi:hypothetical protein CVT26_005482 [Gymnopilus dilepis]|uniref:F-box domain-containing protein n=1 Tax=Gymnopilus dilepis TaxID=231916 RepID=A0A409WJL3_9AGAR|nr:hypothetical protein CVT26_005482 [Gymnopilus dilepis]
MVENSALSTDWVIHQVPPDIWRHVFDLIHPKLHPFMYKDVNDIIRLSHVCSSWRDIVTNAPELWTCIDVIIDLQIPYYVKPGVELLSLTLRNARDMPLIMSLLVLEAGSSEHLKFDSIVKSTKLFFQAAKRAKHLELALSEDFPFEQVEAEIQAVPLLQSLSINLPYSERGIVENLSNTWKDSPFLRSLELQGSGLHLQSIDEFQTLHFPFRQLTSLNIGCHLHIDEFCRLVSLTPFLTSLTSSAVRDPEDSGDVEPVELLQLKELTLQGGYRLRISPEPTTRLLPYIVSPSLMALRLVDDYAWSSRSFNTFLQKSSPRLEHLVLDIANLDEDKKIDCLRSLPFLRTLNFRGAAIISPIRSVFCAAMKEWDASTREFVLCPRLEKLSIDYSDLNDTTSTIFPDMLEDRWQRSLAAGQMFKLELTTHRDLDLDGGPELASPISRILILKESGMDVQVKLDERGVRSSDWW